jgi:hypothetical protein
MKSHQGALLLKSASMAVFGAPIAKMMKISTPRGGLGLRFGAPFVPIRGCSAVRCARSDRKGRGFFA